MITMYRCSHSSSSLSCAPYSAHTCRCRAAFFTHFLARLPPPRAHTRIARAAPAAAAPAAAPRSAPARTRCARRARITLLARRRAWRMRARRTCACARAHAARAFAARCAHARAARIFLPRAPYRANFHFRGWRRRRQKMAAPLNEQGGSKRGAYAQRIFPGDNNLYSTYLSSARATSKNMLCAWPLRGVA